MSNDKDNEAEFARDCGADSSDAESIVRARPFFASQSSLHSVFQDSKHEAGEGKYRHAFPTTTRENMEGYWVVS